MPSQSGAVLPGWRVYPHFIRHRHLAAVVGRQRDNTRRAAYKDYDRSARLSGPMTWNSLPVKLWTSGHRDIHKKTQKSSLQLLWPLKDSRTLSHVRNSSYSGNCQYVSVVIHSFIHSFKWFVTVNDCYVVQVNVECCFDILAFTDTDIVGEVCPSIHRHHWQLGMLWLLEWSMSGILRTQVC